MLTGSKLQKPQALWHFEAVSIANKQKQKEAQIQNLLLSTHSKALMTIVLRSSRHPVLCKLQFEATNTDFLLDHIQQVNLILFLVKKTKQKTTTEVVKKKKNPQRPHCFTPDERCWSLSKYKSSLLSTRSKALISLTKQSTPCAAHRNSRLQILISY